MRILYFTRDYSSHDYRFLSALAHTSHRVYYLRLEQRGHPLEDRALPPEVEIAHWKGGKSPARLQDGPGLLLSLKEVLHRIQPDLVQAGPLQRSAFLVALAGFRPLVSMSWGYDLLHDARRSAWWRWATRYTLRHSAALVADCDTLRRLAVAYGMPAGRIVTFPWGIDLQHFSPAAPPQTAPPTPSGQPFTLLSTRNWEPLYGVDLIAQAFAKVVAAAAPGPALRLVMLGNGSQAGRLRQILTPVQTAPLPAASLDESGAAHFERVLFPGQVRYTDLPRFYRSADLYVAATHSDGSSISLLEAMACGCPVIVSDIPGNREWVTPGENGWLFPDGDANALAQTILQAIEQRQRLPAMGQAARRIAEQRADWKQNFPKLLDAYAIALNPGSPR